MALTEIKDLQSQRTKIIRFVVKGKPIPQGRPQFVAKTKRAVDPKNCRVQKAHIQDVAAEEARAQKFTICPKGMPVRVKVLAFKSYSVKSNPVWWRRGAEDGIIVPTKKTGDADNIIKLILDALNGVLFEDDCQIFSLQYETRYSSEPRVEVEIEGYYINLGDVKASYEEQIKKEQYEKQKKNIKDTEFQ